MGLQKFIVCTLKNPDGSTYEGAAITEEAYNSEAFRKNFELKIKKARMVSFDSEEYLKLTGLTREQVDMLKPKPVPTIVKKVEKPFDFTKIEDTSKVESPVATKRTYTKRTGKTKTAA